MDDDSDAIEVVKREAIGVSVVSVGEIFDECSTELDSG